MRLSSTIATTLVTLATLALAGAAVAQPASPATAWVVITADMPEAEVFLDGERIGRTPVRIDDVALGEHVVMVRAGGRTGTRIFSLRETGRTIRVPLTDYDRPLAVGLEGALGFRGDSALLHSGLAVAYHIPQHELGIVADWFDIRGSRELIVQGVMARLEYAYVPWSVSGGQNTWIQPLKIRGRVNVARTTELSVLQPNGSRAENTVGALGGGLAVAAELQGARLGLEPSFYYDMYGLRSLTVGQENLRPPLDNGGFNLRLKFYF
jgi:hypothetical protein